MQDLWVRLCARTDQDGIQNIQGYLFQTAQNLLVDRMRRADVRKQRAHEPLLEDHHPVEQLTPERVAMGRETVTRIVDRIHALPERTRDVFILNRFEGLAYGAIAAKIGISVSAVEKHIVKALHDLIQSERDSDG